MGHNPIQMQPCNFSAKEKNSVNLQWNVCNNLLYFLNTADCCKKKKGFGEMRSSLLLNNAGKTLNVAMNCIWKHSFGTYSLVTSIYWYGMFTHGRFGGTGENKF